jgi:hypothetical protein
MSPAPVRELPSGSRPPSYSLSHKTTSAPKESRRVSRPRYRDHLPRDPFAR